MTLGKALWLQRRYHENLDMRLKMQSAWVRTAVWAQDDDWQRLLQDE